VSGITDTHQQRQSHSDDDKEKEEDERMIRRRGMMLRGIHGAMKCGERYPTCPNCRGELTYLYLLYDHDDDDNDAHGAAKQRGGRQHPRQYESRIRRGSVSAREMTHDDDESTTLRARRLQNLLPPVCRVCRMQACRMHLLFDDGVANKVYELHK